jgi:hypothetical protein
MVLKKLSKRLLTRVHHRKLYKHRKNLTLKLFITNNVAGQNTALRNNKVRLGVRHRAFFFFLKLANDNILYLLPHYMVQLNEIKF